MDECQPTLTLQCASPPVRRVVVIAVEFYFGAEIKNGTDFDLRRGFRHHDQRTDTELAGGERNALSVIAGGCTDDPGSGRLGPEVGDLVVGAAQLEREHRLQIFPFEEDLIAEPRREAPRVLKGRLDRDVVDARFQDQLKVIGVHRASLRAVHARSQPGECRASGRGTPSGCGRFVQAPPGKKCRPTGRIRPAPWAAAPWSVARGLPIRAPAPGR